MEYKKNVAITFNYIFTVSIEGNCNIQKDAPGSFFQNYIACILKSKDGVNTNLMLENRGRGKYQFHITKAGDYGCSMSDLVPSEWRTKVLNHICENFVRGLALSSYPTSYSNKMIENSARIVIYDAHVTDIMDDPYTHPLYDHVISSS